MRRNDLIPAMALAACLAPAVCRASAGTEAASFLDIPVGGRAAAMGASYSALAEDAYAPVWNPGGLGFLDASEAAFMHLMCLETVSCEYASLAHPFRSGTAAGLSVQYMSPGRVQSLDENGADLGTFSGHYAAYSLALGQRLDERLSVGATGKVLNARISDVSAHSFAADVGALAKPTSRLRLALVLANLGSRMRFLEQADALPSQVRFGGAYSLRETFTVSMEGDHRFNGLSSFHFGAEWLPSEFAALRAGYRTDTVKSLSAIAGLTVGVGLHLWGQEFDYAWVPLGDLGTTQYFSLMFKFQAPKSAPKQP